VLPRAPAGAPLKGGLAPAPPVSRSTGVGKLPAGKIGRLFEGAPKLQATAARPTPAPPRLPGGPLLQAINQRVAAETRALAGIKPPTATTTPGGGGGSMLAAIEGLPHLVGAIASDVPKEFTGEGAAERGLGAVGNALATAETKGYAHIGLKGLGEVVGNAGRDIVELPAQVLPTLYVAGKAALNSRVNADTPGRSNEEVGRLVNNYVKESAPASLLTGHPGRALHDLKKNPVYAALEVSGGLAAADRAAGAVARSGALGSEAQSAASLADPGATTVSREPQQLLGPATVPRDPYSKGLVRNLHQKGQDPSVRPGETALETVRGKNLARQLTTHFDRQAGVLEAVRRNNRGQVVDARMAALKGQPIKGTSLSVPIPGSRAVNPFARGLLADPKVLDPATGLPLYRTQLANLVEYHNADVPGETGAQRDLRMQNVAHYQGLLDDRRLERNPHAAYAAAGKYAADLKRLEPALVEHHIVANPQSLRAAKLTDPFQFHWRGQQPLVEENPPLNATGVRYMQALKAREDAYAARRGTKAEIAREGAQASPRELLARHQANIVAHHQAVADLKGFGEPAPGSLQESPFSIATPSRAGVPATGRTHIPISQVEDELRSVHGVEPDRIGFVSNRPYVDPSSAYYKDVTDPRNAGFNPQRFRTGTAFAHGQYDVSPDALTQQHLSNRALIDQALASRMQVKTYALTREHLAKLLDEHPNDRHARMVARELRGKGPTYFDRNGNTSAWDNADRAIREVEHLKPSMKLRPGRIAHPFAPKAVLGDLARIASPRDALDPNLWAQERGLDQFPTDPTLQHLDTGPVGVYHDAIVKQLQRYTKDTGNANVSLLRAPASFWRRANIAFSTKHVLGLGQELGIRAAVNKVGPISLLRGHRLLNLVEQAASDPAFLREHPEAELNAQRLAAQVHGTVAHQTQMLQRHINEDQLATTPFGATAKALRAGAAHPIAGAPLRAVKAVAQTYSGVASKILEAERKVLERPAQIAGLGKVANDEARRIMGASLHPFGAVTEAERSIAKGMLDPKAIDHASRQMIQFWGDWNSASPTTKRILSVAPFWRWYSNSLRFLYTTMPVHHPAKTALLTILDQATAQQRGALGQGVDANPATKLEADQQGSVPIGKGFVAGQQYYTPQGAVSGAGNTPLGLPTTAVSLLAPEVADAYKAITGSNSFGQTLENAQREPITAPGERVKLAALALLESFIPPYRQAMAVAAGGKSQATGSTLWNLQTKGTVHRDPISEALGIPPGLWAAFKPIKTTTERTESGQPRSTEGSLRKESLRREAGPRKESGGLRKETTPLRKEG